MKNDEYCIEQFFIEQSFPDGTSLVGDAYDFKEALRIKKRLEELNVDINAQLLKREILIVDTYLSEKQVNE